MKSLLSLAILCGLAACSTSKGLHFKTDREKRLDALTAFSATLSKRDYAAAVAQLDPKDQALILDSAGNVSPSMEGRLAALKLSTLYRNPMIVVSGKKIIGIAAILPVLGQADPKTVEEAASMEDTVPAARIKAADEERKSEQELRVATEAFFRSVRDHNWNKALSYVDENERRVFMHKDGKLRIGTQRRLEAIDTSSREALTLMGGKLTGVVLIAPDQASN